MNNASAQALQQSTSESGAQYDGMLSMPTIHVSEEERAQPSMHEGSHKAGWDLFQANGCLLIKNAFSPSYLQQLYNEYLATYAAYLNEQHSPDALSVGGLRKLVTVELKGPFNSRELYANPFVYPLLASLLGPKMILNSVAVVHSLPGAPIQHIHRDHPHLFQDSSEHWKVQRFLPPHAITVVIPLVPLNAMTGSTRMWPGSHHKQIPPPPDHQPFVDPVAEVGDCLFMDYRLLHRGLPNRSSGVRPVIYNVYGRRWFRDEVNYIKQQPLVISDEEYAKMPEEYRYLVRWVKNGR